MTSKKAKGVISLITPISALVTKNRYEKQENEIATVVSLVDNDE